MFCFEFTLPRTCTIIAAKTCRNTSIYLVDLLCFVSSSFFFWLFLNKMLFVVGCSQNFRCCFFALLISLNWNSYYLRSMASLNTFHWVRLRCAHTTLSRARMQTNERTIDRPTERIKQFLWLGIDLITQKLYTVPILCVIAARWFVCFPVSLFFLSFVLNQFL